MDSHITVIVHYTHFYHSQIFTIHGGAGDEMEYRTELSSEFHSFPMVGVGIGIIS